MYILGRMPPHQDGFRQDTYELEDIVVPFASSPITADISDLEDDTLGLIPDSQPLLLTGAIYSHVSPRLPQSSLKTQPSTTMEKRGFIGFFKKLDNLLRIEAEDGLSTAQLMLTNHDLKPVEPERRQWRGRNFVAFWIADSFNIVSSDNGFRIPRMLC